MKLIPVFTKKIEKLLSINNLLIKLYGLYYKSIVKKEIELGNICKGDCVLCIGGGPLPYTAIEIANQTGADVEVVDIDPEAVTIAKQVIEKLNLVDQIKIRLQEGQKVNTENFSVVHVALQAYPHDEILKNILNGAKRGTRILMRKPKDCLMDMYSQLPSTYSRDNIKQIVQTNLTMKSTLLLTKNWGRNEIEEKATASIAGNDFSSDSALVS